MCSMGNIRVTACLEEYDPSYPELRPEWPYMVPEEHKIGREGCEDESRTNLLYGYLWGKIKD